MKLTYCIFFLFITLFFLRGQTTVQQFYPSNALEEIEVLLQEEKSTRNLVKLGDLYHSIERYRKAFYYFEKALQKDSTDLHIYKVAETATRLRNNKKALKLYRILSVKDSLNTVLRYRIAKFLLKQHEYDATIKELELLSQIDTLHPTYPYQIGLLFSKKSNFSKAIDYFLESYKRDTTYVENLFQLSNSFYKLSIEESLNIFLEKGIAIAPSHKNLNHLNVNKLR